MPSAVPPLDRSIDSCVCSVQTVLPPALGVADGVDRQQRRLGLDVVHVGRVGDAGALHRLLHGRGDLGDHRGAADVLGQQHLAHREADGQPRLVGLRRAWSAGTVAKIVACGLITPSVPPDQTIGICLTSSALRLPLATSTSRNARSAMMRV